MVVNLDEKKIARIKLGELLGYFCLAVAAAGIICFIVCYPIAEVKNLPALLTVSYTVPPILIALGAAGGALCNIKFGGDADRLISKYILDICLENPGAMHPERDSLTFYISFEGCTFSMHANGYKESLIFDFSAFKRLSLTRRAAIANEIGNRLISTFCKLYERGANYKEVNFTVEGTKKKKFVPIIVNGVPDKKSFKIYLKNKK